METKECGENKKNVKVIDHSDREWSTADHQLYSRNEELLFSKKTTYFKIHTVVELDENNKPHQVVILEHKSGSVVAINQDDDNVIAKELPKPPSQSDTLKEVKRDSPEVLFYKVAKEPGSELYYFKSYLKDKQRILGFDQEGNPMNTSQVQPKQQESLFSVV
ncbi:uncharacterized protein LOC113665788 isoform X1 [Pocillopora damicornis]|uniref:uncharacterized protein LOC113665788 isoform X1 n=1 Tax=Pocillopora damicornis TaxID=46731 RepID=UPI000F555619|nr:uncharacterized protein LOC113665788 isoform X1 [Pocillopora damicornis]